MEFWQRYGSYQHTRPAGQAVQTPIDWLANVGLSCAQWATMSLSQKLSTVAVNRFGGIALVGAPQVIAFSQSIDAACTADVSGCVYPNPMPTVQADIDTWNASHPSCTPISSLPGNNTYHPFFQIPGSSSTPTPTGTPATNVIAATVSVPPGATFPTNLSVQVDGNAAANPPATINAQSALYSFPGLTDGAHTLTTSSPTTQSTSQSVSVAGGQTTQVSVVLPPAAAPGLSGCNGLMIAFLAANPAYGTVSGGTLAQPNAQGLAAFVAANPTCAQDPTITYYQQQLSLMQSVPAPAPSSGVSTKTILIGVGVVAALGLGYWFLTREPATTGAAPASQLKSTRSVEATE